VACMGEKSNVCKVFVGKPEEKRSLRRSRHRWLILAVWGGGYGLDSSG
jgi:hypothetical protein